MPVTGFSVAAAGEAMSSVAALIAGFSFAVLVWLVERHVHADTDPAADAIIEEALVFLVLTFVGNILAALMWALISGETSVTVTRPGVLNFIAAFIFSMLVPLTLQSMVFVVATTGSFRAINLFRRVFFATLIAGYAFQWTSTAGFVATVDQSMGVTSARPVLFFGIGPLTTVMLLVASIISGRGRAARRWASSPLSFSNFVSIWLFTMVLCAVTFGYIQASSPNAILPVWVAGVGNVFWAVTVGWATLFLPAREGTGEVASTG